MTPFMYNKVTKPNNSTINNKRLPQLPSLILPPQGNIPKVNLGNPTNNMQPLLSEEDIKKMMESLYLISKDNINTESDSEESDGVIPEKIPNENDVINHKKAILEEGDPEERIFTQSQFNKSTFNPNWYDEYIEKNIPEGRRIYQDYDYPRIIELRDYLNKKNPNHPNPANIIDFFMWAKGTNSNHFIHRQLGTFQSLFTWVTKQKDGDGNQIYPDVIGYRPRLKDYDMNYIMDKLKQEYKTQSDAGVKNPKPTLNHLIKFMQEKEEQKEKNEKNKAALQVTLGEFLQYLQKKFTES